MRSAVPRAVFLRALMWLLALHFANISRSPFSASQELLQRQIPVRIYGGAKTFGGQGVCAMRVTIDQTHATPTSN